MKERRTDSNTPLMNEKIRAPQVQVITQDGGNIGVVSRDEALSMAQQVDLDLVMLADNGEHGVPVTKIMDFGKLLYERKKKKSEAKKHQVVVQVKEIKIRPKIGDHDYKTKMKQAADFLQAGKRVKVTLCFRGRENAQKKERGTELFSKVDATFQEYNIPGLDHERDSMMGQFWSRVYYVKGNKK